MDYDLAFDKFYEQNWNNATKLAIMFQFLDETPNPSVEKFEVFLKNLVDNNDN